MNALESVKRRAKALKVALGRDRYLYLIAAIIGFLDSLAAVALKGSVRLIEELAKSAVGVSGVPMLLAAFPLAGIALAIAWNRLVVRADISHGVSGVLEVIASPSERIKPHNIFSSIVGCALTAGFGGSVGMEGPIVATGAALGDNVASLSDADYKRRMILIGCGAAGAISAIFKAPFAGLVFCVEVFALDVASSSVIALLVSSAVACLSSMVMSGNRIEYAFAVHRQFNPVNIPLYVLLGVVVAFVSVYFMRASRAVESSLKKVRSVPLRACAGALIVGVAIALFPALYGEGALAMRSMLSDRMADLFTGSPLDALAGNRLLLPALLVALAVAKPVAMSATTGSGGIGGIFAPTMFAGCAVGYAFAVLCNFTGLTDLPPMNFALAGMAGAISGVMAAPLTGVFLVAELTGGYELFVPLIVVASVSTVIARRFEPYSMYAYRLGKSGRLITRHMDKAVLTLLSTEGLVDSSRPSLCVRDGLEAIARAFVDDPRTTYPAFESDGSFAGFIRSRDSFPILADPILREGLIVDDLVRPAKATLQPHADAAALVAAFNASGADVLPVLDDGRYVGLVEKASLLDAYRAKLAELSDGDA
jgi:chloride channel protein, CIC family